MFYYYLNRSGENEFVLSAFGSFIISDKENCLLYLF